jgi:phosphonate transport system ATP-binding protein
VSGLEIEGLSVRFGAKAALDGLSLRVPAGQMLGVIGRSGAGKSTLLRAINRLAPISGGRVLADGRDVSRLKGRALRAWRAQTAMIFQQFNLAPRLDVLTNVLIGRAFTLPVWRTLLKSFTPEERTVALKALDRMGLVEAALQRADTLSGGQQQRVAIAKALLQAPKVILADEPIASLDPVNADVVMAALRQINKEDGITVIANLHDLEYARAYCDRIVGLNKGKLVFDGPPAALDAAAETAIYGQDLAAPAAA